VSGNETTAGLFPERPSVDPKSPYYNAEILSCDVGIRFKGVVLGAGSISTLR
jgi:hypothetical protein